jgi:hypothetical protein
MIFLTIVFLIGPDHLQWAINSAAAQPINPPRTTPKLQEVVEALKAATPAYENDADSDGLPDSVEIIIGTDPNSADTDMDRLDDSFEITNNLDPLDPDSNHDGLPDYYEVHDVPSLDSDGDGVQNAWDFDNDGDGVNDAVDFSPFASSAVQESFHFDVKTRGDTLYASFQIRPKNPKHLLLFDQKWDWPDNDKEGAMQDRDGSKEDVIILPMLALTVNSPPDQNDVAPYGIVVEGQNISVPLLPVFEHGTIVAFTGRMVYPVSAPNDLVMDVKLIWKVIGRNDPGESLFGQNTLLATYGEEFMLTGLSFDENFRSDAALFYHNDVNRTVAANLLLAYKFLRDFENHVTDMPGVLDSNNVNVAHQLGSFSHRDEALDSLMNQMIPAALDWLPQDQNLPVIAVLEDMSANLDMSDFTSTSTNSFSVDLTAAPVMVSKTLKTTWYNTSAREALSTRDVMAQIQALGLEATASYTLMTLMLYWDAGEQVRYDPVDPPTISLQDFQLVSPAVQNIVGMGLSGLAVFYNTSLGLKGLQAYQSIKFLQANGWHLSSGGQPLVDLTRLGNCGKFKQWVKICDRLDDTLSMWKMADKALKGVEIVAVVADIGVSIYSMVAICESDASGFAKSGALLKAGMQMNYAIVLFGIACIPYVGWAIALGLELGDIFGGWSNDVFDSLVDLMVNVSYTVTPEITFLEGPTIDIDDSDGDGLDVGDRITFTSRLQGKIEGDTSHWGLVWPSYILPYHQIYAPAGSSSQTGSPYSNSVYFGWCYQGTQIPIGNWNYIQNQEQAWTADEYNSGGWVKPGTAMVNFPVTIKTEALYELWYEYEVFHFFVFYWYWGVYEDYQCGKTPAEQTTLYFDVLPSSIGDFAQWRGITPLDRDGDGLADVNDAKVANQSLYDTDGDGLNDKFEVDNGTDPKKYDTDGDGLIDWFEIQFGTDPHNPDTDGDGLSDYLEVAGWLIRFTYQGQSFTTQVYSDPTIPDSDGDGLNDRAEYDSGLNPRSGDTNGDGIGDTAGSHDGQLTALELAADANMPCGISDIAIDANSNVYVLAYKYYSSDAGIYLMKYDSNLNPVSEWALTENDSDILWYAERLAIDSKNKLIHIAVNDSHTNEAGLITFDFNGLRLDSALWGKRTQDAIVALTVGPEDNVYVLRYGWAPNAVDVYDSNHTLIGNWGAYDTRLQETYTQGSDQIRRTYYAGGPDTFHSVRDIAVNDEGYIYIPESVPPDYYEIWTCSPYLPNWCSWWNCSTCGTTKLFDDRIMKCTIDGTYLTDMSSFTDPNSGQQESIEYPKGIELGLDGYLYVINSYEPIILKFDRNLIPVTSWQVDSWTRQYQVQGSDWGPEYRDMVVDGQGNVYTYFSINAETEEWGVVEKYSQTAGSGLPVTDPNPDRDGDGMNNGVETGGWTVTFTAQAGTCTLDVNSDPLLVDTDLDGLTDANEYDIGSNPRNPDTDGDGLSDFDEIRVLSPKTSPLHFDTDGDGLSDGAEIAFGSNPNNTDTDGDGLSDYEEFNLGSDPNNPDTDRDGVNDLQEKQLHSSITSPDTDGDSMFDGAELASGTDVNDSDTDHDGLQDGTEIVYNANPLNPDSDNDGVPDGLEVEKHLDPASSDTDNDGVPDGTEIDQGTNPWTGDSDHDGVPDSQDNPNNLAPDVNNAHPNMEYLWPPNNKMVEITIEGVTDPDGDAFGIVVTGVTSDEPAITSAGDKQTPDALIDSTGKLFLRAERSGSGNGRVYEISFIAGDSKGEYKRGKVQVKVPHSNAKNVRICIDDGQQYNLLPR